MKAFLVTAMRSGGGKTVMTCALTAALKKRGLRVNAFKCGPDYIDPMFHQRVLGVPSRNLDLFLQREAGVKRSFRKASGDVAVVEGVMGYYDGTGGGTEASTWELACSLNLPAVLVLRPGGSGATLAAQVHGMQTFRSSSRIRALLLTDCPERVALFLTPVLERECGIPVLGFMPPMREAELESRHLGLLTAEEIGDFSGRMDRLAGQICRTVDLDRLLDLAGEKEFTIPVRPGTAEKPCCRIAVARDEAFCFLYEDNLDALQSAGAELVFFSPLRDRNLPAADGLYLCGGYPELHAAGLEKNRSMRHDIARKISAGMPTVAECGGFLYLQQSLEDMEGNARQMCGILPGKGIRTGRLQRFGYLSLRAEEDSMLLRKGEILPAHEFHYWDCTGNGEDLIAEKANGKSWRCGFTDRNLYAAFPHLHFGGELPLAERFVKACVNNEQN